MGLIDMQFILALACYYIVSSNARQINMYDYCNGFDGDVDVTVYSSDKVSLKPGNSWPGGSSCSIVLKAGDGFSNLYYEFESFTILSGFTLKIEAGYADQFYFDEATYSSQYYPILLEPLSIKPYMKLTVTRDPTAGLSGYIDFVVTIYIPDTGSDYLDISHAIGLTIGAIVGIVIGAIALIVIIIVVIVCCVVRSSNRGGSGGTVVTQPVVMQGQPYTGQQFTGHPYTGQPFTGQPYAGQPYAGQPYAGQSYGVQPYPGGGSHPMQTYSFPAGQPVNSGPSAPQSNTDNL